MTVRDRFNDRVREMEQAGYPFVGYLHAHGYAVYRTDAFRNTRQIRAAGLFRTKEGPFENGRFYPSYSTTLHLHRKSFDKLVEKLRRRGELWCLVENDGNGSGTRWYWE